MSSLNPAPTAFCVGDFNHPEFREAADWLTRHAAVWRQPNLAATLREAWPAEPALVLLAQARSGEHSALELEALHRRAPLTRLAVLEGFWCEGEQRSGRPLPGVTRLEATHWRHFAAPQLEAFLAGRPSVFDAPRTADLTEAVFAARGGAAAACTRAPESAAATRRGAVVVLASSPLEQEGIAAACALAGLHADAEAARPAAVIWSGDALSTAAQDELTRLRARHGGARFVVLLGFPRWPEIEWARQRLQGDVLAKPFLLGELHHALTGEG